METDRWWFVWRVDGRQFEVQLLDPDGKAISAARFAVGASEVTVAGEQVPTAVLRAAEQRREGEGQYIDGAGRLVDWMGQSLG